MKNFRFIYTCDGFTVTHVRFHCQMGVIPPFEEFDLRLKVREGAVGDVHCCTSFLLDSFRGFDLLILTAWWPLATVVDPWT